MTSRKAGRPFRSPLIVCRPESREDDPQRLGRLLAAVGDGADRRPLIGCAVVLVALLVVTASVPAVAFAQEAPPASYYGEATVNGEPAEPGTEIEAVVDGTVYDTIGVGQNGSFGGPGPFEEKLVVNESASGREVAFRVGNVTADTTVTWESGDVRELNLSFTGVDTGGGADEADGGNDGSDDTDESNTTDRTDESNGTDGSDGGTGGTDNANGSGTTDGTGNTQDGDGTDNTEQTDSSRDGGNGDESDGTDSDNGETQPAGDGTDGADEGSGGGGDATGSDDSGAAPDAESDSGSSNTAEGVRRAEATLESTSDGDSRRATFDSDVPVDSVTFESDGVTGSVEVTAMESAPEDIEPSPGETVQVANVTVPEPARDASAALRLTVSTDRLDAIGAAPDELRVNRLRDGEWNALETDVTERTTSGVVLEAETPGFSYFAVSAVSEPEAAAVVEPHGVAPGESIRLDGSNSTVDHGEIAAYEWTVDGRTLSGETAAVTLSNEGEYEVELTVRTDAGETDTAVATVTVEAAGGASTETGPGNGSTDEPAEEPAAIGLPAIGALALTALTGAIIVAARRRGSNDDPLR